jgi:hypothetical protein
VGSCGVIPVVPVGWHFSLRFLGPRIHQPSSQPSDQGNEYESGMPPCPVVVLSGLCDLEDVILHGND